MRHYGYRYGKSEKADAPIQSNWSEACASVLSKRCPTSRHTLGTSLQKSEAQSEISVFPLIGFSRACYSLYIVFLARYWPQSYWLSKWESSFTDWSTRVALMIGGLELGVIIPDWSYVVRKRTDAHRVKRMGRTSHMTHTSLRRTLSHVPTERRCVSHRKASIRRIILRRTPL